LGCVCVGVCSYSSLRFPCSSNSFYPSALGLNLASFRRPLRCLHSTLRFPRFHNSSPLLFPPPDRPTLQPLATQPNQIDLRSSCRSFTSNWSLSNPAHRQHHWQYSSLVPPLVLTRYCSLPTTAYSHSSPPVPTAYLHCSLPIHNTRRPFILHCFLFTAHCLLRISRCLFTLLTAYPHCSPPIHIMYCLFTLY
jgi:hypothetical protein